MKPARDPSTDYRALVARGYDACAERFNASRAVQHAGELAPLLERLPAGSRVLDLGCGAGLPVTRALAATHNVVGVDISAAQLALARDQVPSATFVRGDMSTIAFPDRSFDAVVSFYAVFHLPREQHCALFERVHGWLGPGGWFFASLAFPSEEAYTEEFFGTEMYWSNYGLDDYRAMLRESRFEIEHESLLSHGYDGDAPVERHPLVLARKKT